MTIRLRPHHFFCLLTYKGEGYSRHFTKNFDKIIKRILQKEDIVFVSGADDICLPILQTENPHCLNPSIILRDEYAVAYAKEALSLPIQSGMHLQITKTLLKNMQLSFLENPKRSFCKNCQWENMCNQIAEDGFLCTKINSF